MMDHFMAETDAICLHVFFRDNIPLVSLLTDLCERENKCGCALRPVFPRSFLLECDNIVNICKYRKFAAMLFDFASKHCDLNQLKLVCFFSVHVFAQLCVDGINHVGRETREEGKAALRVVREDRERVERGSRQWIGMVGICRDVLWLSRLQRSRRVCKMRCMQLWSLWRFDWTSSRNI